MRLRAAIAATAFIAGYAHAAFDINAERLPPGFRGENVKAIIETIRKNPLAKAKDEFESSEQYEARLEKAKAIRLPSGSRLGDAMAIFVSLDGYESGATYSADSQKLSLTWNPEPWYGRGDSDGMVRATATSERVDKGSFVASNAFGARATVRSFLVKEWLVVFPNGNGPAIFGEIEMPPGAAKDLKANLGLLVIGYPEPPFIDTGWDQYSATVQSPRQTRIEYIALRIRPVDLWLVNKRTGEIAWKRGF